MTGIITAYAEERFSRPTGLEPVPSRDTRPAVILVALASRIRDVDASVSGTLGTHLYVSTFPKITYDARLS